MHYIIDRYGNFLLKNENNELLWPDIKYFFNFNRNETKRPAQFLNHTEAKKEIEKQGFVPNHSPMTIKFITDIIEPETLLKMNHDKINNTTDQDNPINPKKEYKSTKPSNQTPKEHKNPKNSTPKKDSYKPKKEKSEK